MNSFKNRNDARPGQISMDNTFGKYSSDELKLINHRANLSGVQHQHNISPRDPAPGESVKVHMTTTSEPAIRKARLRYTIDGSDPRQWPNTAEEVDVFPVGYEWDTQLWDYVNLWEAEIPPQPEGTIVTYYISAEPYISSGKGNTQFLYPDTPDAEERVQHATMIHFNNIPPDTPFRPAPQSDIPLFCYHVDRLKAPEWVRDAIIYHIFLDRFYPGDGRDWRQTDDLGGFCGGTLWGLRDKLDYLAELGVNCLWLSPCWKSPSNHGYDVADYEVIEPRLGGEEALHAVVEGAHERGIRILLDLVCNHLSDEHPIFIDAASSENSPYRDWFIFDERYRHGYRSFFNVKNMPKINLETPSAREWMISMAIKQLRDFDVDGFRLDVADGAGANFWTHCRPRLRAVKPDCALIGEIVDSPEYLRVYEGRLDGCLDFSTNEALRNTFAWETWILERYEEFKWSHDLYFDPDFILPSFLDNHDMDRFSLIAGNDRDKIKRAVEAQMLLPNPPIILYGTEVGLRQRVSTRGSTLDQCRVPMVWGDEQDQDLLAFYKGQIHNRKNKKGKDT